jgi:hypothetical protein
MEAAAMQDDYSATWTLYIARHVDGEKRAITRLQLERFTVKDGIDDLCTDALFALQIRCTGNGGEEQCAEEENH